MVNNQVIAEHLSPEGNKPLVTICCITYNHAKYIRDAMEGFLKQTTTFGFEVIVNDDASTDGTTEILKEYQQRYPNVVFPIFQRENQYSKGYRSLAARNIFPVARGKYFAMCEGDDYWTDPLKLQKQVDFLEKHSDCSCCYHPVRWIYAKGTTPDKTEGPSVSGDVVFPPEAIIGGLFIRMVSIVFRAAVFQDIPNWIFSSPNGDIPIQLVCASKGSIGYLSGEAMAVYRRGTEGSWSSNSYGAKAERVEWTKKWLHDNLKMLNLFNENSGYAYNKLLRRRKKRLVAEAFSRLQDISGRLAILPLMAKHVDALICILDGNIAVFWLRFALGRRAGKAVYKKIRSKRKNRA